jgi:hypothetical protein
MTRRNAVVGLISALIDQREATSSRAPTQQPAVVDILFADDQRARIDASDYRGRSWLAALHQMERNGLPAYVEVDEATSLISEVLVPITVTVGELRDFEDHVDVELVISQARHRLSRSNPDFDELLNRLSDASARNSPVLVTESNDEHEIIDVRPPPPGTAVRQTEPAPTSGDVSAQAPPVSLATARRMFAMVDGLTCCSAAPAPPGIPFTYPDDGCWGRAHEMFRLMSAAGVVTDKVWIYGSLHVVSANKPDCNVHWGWHVAPTLPVATSSGNQTYVIDPALFKEPVTQATWASVQGDPNPTLVPSAGEVFYRSRTGGVGYDHDYSQTNTVLATYRSQLQVRSASDGPPPYPQCLPRRAGVQWFGTLEPGASRRWYTSGWPAAWHVFWTIMPTSICPGAPQLSWKVATERASATESTYWITVKNLTSRPVRFEGRYDILSR